MYYGLEHVAVQKNLRIQKHIEREMKKIQTHISTCFRYMPLKYPSSIASMSFLFVYSKARLASQNRLLPFSGMRSVVQMHPADQFVV